MSYYGYKSDAPFYLSVMAFLSLGAGSIYAYTEGVFNRDAQEIVQELTQFKRCDINLRTFSNVGVNEDYEEYTYYTDHKVLECELSDKQKANPEAYAKAEKIKDELGTEVWRLPSKIHEEVQVELLKHNAKKFPDETVESIAENSKHFTTCDVVKVEDKNAIKCSFSTVQMESEDAVESGRNSLAVMNVQVPQLNEVSINKLKEKIQKIKEDNEAFVKANGYNMPF